MRRRAKRVTPADVLTIVLLLVAAPYLYGTCRQIGESGETRYAHAAAISAASILAGILVRIFRRRPER